MQKTLLESFHTILDVVTAETGLTQVVHQFVVGAYRQATVVIDPLDYELVGVVTCVHGDGFALVDTYWELPSVDYLKSRLCPC